MAFELSRTRGPGCISDLRFDRMLEGELAAEDARAIDAHVATCESCCARLRELTAARAAAEPEAGAAAAALHARADRSRRPFALAVSSALSLAALAAGVWLAVAPPRLADGELRLKGAHGFGFFVQRGAAVYRGGAGDRLQPGDRLRFVARTGAAAYLAVLSLDGALRATVYYPAGSHAAPLAASAAEQPLPASVRLDDVLGPERLYALFCGAPVALEPLRAALEQRREAFTAPAGCELDSVLVHKVAAP